MKLLLPALRKVFPRFNKRAYTFDDGLAIAEREHIKVVVTNYDDDVMGYFCIRYTKRRVKKFIMVNAKLNPIDRTFVLLHELAHYFLHLPISASQYFHCYRDARRNQSKNECEATGTALILMIPQTLLEATKRTPFYDLSDTEAAYFIKRQRLHEKEDL